MIIDPIDEDDIEDLLEEENYDQNEEDDFQSEMLGDSNDSD